MSDITPPRYGLAIIDPRTGQMSREWYKFLSSLAASIATPTNADDARLIGAMESGDAEAISVSAFSMASKSVNSGADLLGWWPGDQK